nr:synaptobrevin, longin-like domain protein [Tanacetum cinerariifolium]
MARLAFYDYHNMVAILEKSEHNVDFHPIVDFVEASPLRILATIDGNLRTVFESSIRRNLKLNDEARISSLPDAKLFENLTLMGYNISPNRKFTFQKGQFSHQWKYLIHTIIQCMSPKSTGFNEFSSNIVTALVCLATNRGEGSRTPTEPHHTPSLEVQQTSPTTHSSPTLPPVSTVNIPPVIPTVPLPNVTSYNTPYQRQYTRRARIAQSSALLPVADEPASPLRDVSQSKACPTVSRFDAEQDRANIAKSSTFPHESTSRVTSLAADEGREEAAERVSDDTEEMATVLTSMDAAIVLASGVAEVPTGSGSIPTAGPPATEFPLVVMWFPLLFEVNHLNTIPETESDEVIKYSVEILVPIPSESEGISDDTCDVPFCDNSHPLDVLNDHFKIFFNFNDDCTSSDDDSFEDIDYVEASPPDSELVSLEEVKDDILHEKLLNINILIAKIESLNDNPTPDCML